MAGRRTQRLSNSEDPNEPQDPYPRVVQLRQSMGEIGLNEKPIFMAGGVWFLREWEDWLENPELGPIAFQFGTRALLTEESPISEGWKKKLLRLVEGDIFLNKFSPTGFYSSAVHNEFLDELKNRSDRQIAFSATPVGELSKRLEVGPRVGSYMSPDRTRPAQKRGWPTAIPRACVPRIRR